MIVPDLLREAADFIDSNGWTTCRTVDQETGAVCLDGALRVVAGYRYQRILGKFFVMPPTIADVGGTLKSIHLAHHVIGQFLKEHGIDVPPRSYLPKSIVFNDRVAKDADEVKRLLRRTADWIEQHPALAEFHPSAEKVAVHA